MLGSHEHFLGDHCREIIWQSRAIGYASACCIKLVWLKLTVDCWVVQNLGDVRDMPSIRAAPMRAPVSCSTHEARNCLLVEASRDRVIADTVCAVRKY